jgi:hypothetical protein
MPTACARMFMEKISAVKIQTVAPQLGLSRFVLVACYIHPKQIDLQKKAKRNIMNTIAVPTG